MKRMHLRVFSQFFIIMVCSFFTITGVEAQEEGINIRQFAEKYIKAQREAWKGNFEELEALEHKDAVTHMSGMPDISGWEAHKQYIQGASKMMSDLQQQWEYVVGDQNLFSLAYKAKGKIIAEHPTVPLPIGKMINLDYLWVLKLNDGKVAEIWMNGSMNLKD